MKNRKLQRVLTWILTLTMILGTFGETGLALQAADDDAVEAEEAEVVDADDADVPADDADVPDPDESFADTELQVVAPTQTKFAVFEVRADDAEAYLFDKALYTAPEAQEATANTGFTTTLDSVNGITFFVAPLAGYEIKEADLADAIKVTGAYAESDSKLEAGRAGNTDAEKAAAKAANWVMIPDSAFTIAKATKTEVDENVNYDHLTIVAPTQDNPGHDAWYNEYDFSAAWTVTINGASEWLDAYKLAQYHDTNATYNDSFVGTPEEIAAAKKADSTIAEKLTVTITENDTDGAVITGKAIPVTVVGAEKPLAKINYDYSATTTDAIDFANAVDDWTDKTVEVALIGTNEKGEEVKLVIPQVTAFTADYYYAFTPATQNPKTEGLYELKGDGTYELTNDETVTTDKTYYKKDTNNVGANIACCTLDANGKAYLNRLAVRAAYWYGLKGYALTIIIKQNADKAVYVKSATDLATFSTVTADNLTLVATDEAAVWLDPAAATDIDFWVDLADTNAGRTITAVYYQYEGDADRTKLTAQNVNPAVTYTEITGLTETSKANPKANGWYERTGAGTTESPYVYAVTTDTAVTEGHTYYVKKGTDANSTWYKLPVTAARAGKTATLSVDTTETVVYKVSDNGEKLLATITDKTKSETLVGDQNPVPYGPLCTPDTPKDDPVTSWVETGKDYKFQVVAKDDNRIKSVLAKMYAVDGTGGENIELVEDDFGWYTASAITGKLEITVVTEAEPADVHKVSLAVMKDKNGNNTNTTGQEVKEIVTGTVITLNPAYMAYGGEDFSFRVVPSDNKMVKAVSYTMGNATDNKIALTATKALLDGTCYYTIPAVSGNVVIYIEEIDAVRVEKLKNVDATITIGGVELEDGKVARVPAGEDFTFKAVGKNGAEVDTMYFIYAASKDAITKKAQAGQALTGSEDGTYTIAKNNLVVDAANNLFLTAYTVRPGDEGLVVRVYKGDVAPAYATALDKRTTLITSASIYAGGDKATDAKVDNEIEVIARVEKADGTDAKLIKEDETFEWTITDDDLLTLTPDGVKVLFTDAKVKATSKQKAGSDVMSYTYKTGFPNATGYGTDLPIEVKALNTHPRYSGLNLKYTATLADPNNTEMTAATLEGGKMIRLDKTTPVIVNDSMKLAVQNNGALNDGKNIYAFVNDDIATTKNIQSITWSVAPEYESTLVEKPYLVDGRAVFAGIKDADVTISHPQKKENTLTLTAVVLFADGTETVVEDTLELVDMIDGYVVVAYTDGLVWSDPRNPESPDPVIYLETVAGGRNTANVAFRVFDADSFSVAKIRAGIAKLTKAQQDELDAAKDYETYLNLLISFGVIKEITDFTVGEPKVTDVEKSVSLEGSNPLTIKAAKRQVEAENHALITPNIKVGKVQAAADSMKVVVYEELPINMVKVITEDPNSNIDDYDFPQMTEGLAKERPISLIATNIVAAGTGVITGTRGSDDEDYIGFYLTDVEIGTTLTLPTQADFDATTVNPKRTLVGWSVADKDSFTTYLPGRKITIMDLDTDITAIWRYTYAASHVAGQNVTYTQNAVNLYEEIAAEGAQPKHIELGTAGAGTLHLSYGSSIQTKIGYNTVVAAATIGKVTTLGDLYDEDKVAYSALKDTVYTTEGLSFEVVTDNGVCDAPVAGLFTTKTVNGTNVYKVSWTDAAGNVFSTWNDADHKDTNNNLCAVLTVAGEDIASYEVKINEDNTVSDLEVSKVMVLPFAIKKTVTDPNTHAPVVTDITNITADFVSSKLTIADESVAKAEILPGGVAFQIKGLKTGNTTMIFDAVDATGNEAHGEAAITVSASTVTLSINVKNEKDNKDGEDVAENAELQVIKGATNYVDTTQNPATDEMKKDASTISLALQKKGQVVNYPEWSIAVSDYQLSATKTADQATTLTAIPVVSGKEISEAKVIPTALGMNTLTLKYIDEKADTETGYVTNGTPIVWYERDVTMRSYVALAIAGPKVGVADTPSAEADRGFTVSNGTEEIEAGEAAFIRVPYDPALSWTTSADQAAYTSSLKGYSASYTGKVVDGTPTAFTGWKVMSPNVTVAGNTRVAADAAIQDGYAEFTPTTQNPSTEGLYEYVAAKKVFARTADATVTTNKKYYKYTEAVADFAAEGNFVSYATTPAYAVTDPAHGVVVLSPVFGQEKIELAGLPEIIELDDATLSVGGEAAVKVNGSDREYVSVGVKPYTSLGQFALTGTDTEKFVMVPDQDYYPAVAAGKKGYAAPTYNAGAIQTNVDSVWVINAAGATTAITAKPGTNSRTDHFTVAKVYDAPTAAAQNLDRKYVGVSTIYVMANGVLTPYDEITVYLNGEFVDTTAEKNAENEYPIRYMYRGEVLQNGAKTVNGEIHYYQDGEKVLNGVVTLEDGHKILVKNGAQVTEVGYVEYENNAYYVGSDGFLKVSEKFNGELDKDSQYTFYANEDATLAKGAFITLEGKLYYFDGSAHLMIGTGDAFVTITGINEGPWYGTFDYVIGTDGVVKTAQMFTYEGKQYYLNSYGQKVTYKMSEGGKYVDPVTGDIFIISEDDTAVEDDRLAVSNIKWDKWSKVADFQNGKPVMKATVTLTSQKGKNIDPNPRVIEAVVEQTAKTDKKVTFKATVDLSAYYKPGYTEKYGTESIEKDYNVDKDGNITDSGREVPISEDGSIVIVGLEETYYYTGKAIKPAFVIVDEARGGVVLGKGSDYTVKFSNNKKVGKALVTVTGKGNYTGKNGTASFDIKDPLALAKADLGDDAIVAGVKKIAKISGDFTYNGLAQYPATLSVTLADNTVVTLNHDGDGEYSSTEGKAVVVSVCNNVEKGTATVAAVGLDGKVKTANFKIKVAAFGTAKVAEGLEGTYSVKGATPDDLVVTWTNGEDDEVELVEGQDFKASYKNNKAAGNGTIKLTGKGNFKGSLEGTFKINALAPAEIDAVAAYEGVKVSAVKVTVLDAKGFALNQKKQLNVKVLDEDGNEIAANTKLAAGQKITVVVTSKDAANVTIDDAGITADIVVGQNLAKAKVDAKKLTVTYKGEPIELTDENMGSVTVTFGKAKTVLVNHEDFEIVGYTNNVKKGTMTVTIQGTGVDNGRGVFSGTKTFKVKVMPKSIL